MKTPILHNYAYVNCLINFGNGLIRNRNPENQGIDTTIVLVSLLLSELGPKIGIPVIAAIICILPRTLMGARATLFGFLISTLESYRKCKMMMISMTVISNMD